MAGFNPDDYVDVAERIRIFYLKYPNGTLQSEVLFTAGGVLCKAYAYRAPDDALPGIGHAFEPIPGKTTFTKDSEVMNAETSAWGRAIVAVGFETKRVASANEVRNRQPDTSVAPEEARQQSKEPLPAAADAPPTTPREAGATEPQRARISELRGSMLEAGLIDEAAARKLSIAVADVNLSRVKAREILDWLMAKDS